MSLSSVSSILIVEPTLKLWCIINNDEKRFNMGKLSSNGRIEDGQPLSIFNEERE
jgi:hypothetical protein